jgi:hypothetical protein
LDGPDRKWDLGRSLFHFNSRIDRNCPMRDDSLTSLFHARCHPEARSPTEMSSRSGSAAVLAFALGNFGIGGYSGLERIWLSAEVSSGLETQRFDHSVDF